MKTITVRGMEIEVITRDEWDVVTDEQKEINAKKHNRATHGIESCRLCNQTISDKVLDNSWFVHMTVNGDLIPVGIQLDENEGSQGLFPVGASCAKRIPNNFKKKL